MNGDSSSVTDSYRKLNFYIVGRLDDPKISLLRHMVEEIMKKKIQNVSFEFVLAFETPFDLYVEDLIKEDNDFLNFSESPLVYIQHEKKKEIVGSMDNFFKYCVENFGYYEEKSEILFREGNTKILRNYMKSNGNKYCYFDIYIGGQQLERVIFELYYKECPNTCENFFNLCRGFTNEEGEKVTFRDTIFHRIVKRGYIQGGELDNVKSNLIVILEGSRTIYKGEFADENYTVKHSVPGCIGMVKKNKRKHSNESQFYITLGPLASFDNLFVCFGRVIQGFKSIKRIEEVETNLQRPTIKIEIRKSGEYSV